MKGRIVLVMLFLFGLMNNISSQDGDCSCRTDMIFLDGKVRKTPSYKVNKESYESVYANILEKAGTANTINDCHILLNTLLLSLNDNHCKVYSIDKGATEEVKEDPEKFAEFKQSNIFKAYQNPGINLDSLYEVLDSKSKEDIAGIYTRKNYMTLGVFKNQMENNYKAIVLDSEIDIWEKGDMIYTFIPFGNDYLLGVGGSLSSKRLIAYTERIDQGFFFFMGFKKDEEQTNYSAEVLSDAIYDRKELSDEITYLKIGSFNSWYPTLSDAEKFYKSLEGNLTKSKLIVDLRNNGGGGDRNSKILYKKIKDYAKKNKVYVLINHRTISNAEQFAYKLSELDNCQLFGHRTNGTLAYEIKDANYNLPCGNFIAVLTSKKHSKYLEYESQGIEPDVTLNMETDWVDQLKNYIENIK